MYVQFGLFSKSETKGESRIKDREPGRRKQEVGRRCKETEKRICKEETLLTQVINELNDNKLGIIKQADIVRYKHTLSFRDVSTRNLFS